MKTYLKLLFAMLIWGGTFTSARMLGRELDSVISAFLQFLLASYDLLAFLYIKERRFSEYRKETIYWFVGHGFNRYSDV